MTLRLFRPFGSDARAVKANARREVRQMRARLLELKRRIADGADLTDADHRLIAHAGPHTLAYIGYEPKAAHQ